MDKQWVTSRYLPGQVYAASTAYNHRLILTPSWVSVDVLGAPELSGDFVLVPTGAVDGAEGDPVPLDQDDGGVGRTTRTAATEPGEALAGDHYVAYRTEAGLRPLTAPHPAQELGSGPWGAGPVAATTLVPVYVVECDEADVEPDTDGDPTVPRGGAALPFSPPDAPPSPADRLVRERWVYVFYPTPGGTGSRPSSQDSEPGFGFAECYADAAGHFTVEREEGPDGAAPDVHRVLAEQDALLVELAGVDGRAASYSLWLSPFRLPDDRVQALGRYAAGRASLHSSPNDAGVVRSLTGGSLLTPLDLRPVPAAGGRWGYEVPTSRFAAARPGGDGVEVYLTCPLHVAGTLLRETEEAHEKLLAWKSEVAATRALADLVGPQVHDVEHRRTYLADHLRSVSSGSDRDLVAAWEREMEARPVPTPPPARPGTYTLDREGPRATAVDAYSQIDARVRYQTYRVEADAYRRAHPEHALLGSEEALGQWRYGAIVQERQLTARSRYASDRLLRWVRSEPFQAAEQDLALAEDASEAGALSLRHPEALDAAREHLRGAIDGIALSHAGVAALADLYAASGLARSVRGHPLDGFGPTLDAYLDLPYDSPAPPGALSADRLKLWFKLLKKAAKTRVSLVKALAVAVPTAHGGGDEGERAVAFTGLLFVRLAASAGDEQRDFARSVGRVRRTEGGVTVEGGGLDLTCTQITQARTLTEHRADGSTRAYKLVPKTDAPGYASFKASLARFETEANFLFELVNVAQAGWALAVAGEQEEIETADLIAVARSLAGLVGVVNQPGAGGLGLSVARQARLKKNLFAVGVVLDVASTLDTAARGRLDAEATVGAVGTFAGLARATVLGRVADSVGATVRVSRKVRDGDSLGALAEALWTAGTLAISSSGAGGTTGLTVMTGAGALPAAAVFGALALAAAGALMLYQAHAEQQEIEEDDPLVKDGWLAQSFLWGRGVYIGPSRPRTSSGSGRYSGRLGGIGDVAQRAWDAASADVRREARLNGAYLDHAFALVSPGWAPGGAVPSGFDEAIQAQLVGFMEQGFDFRPAVDVVCRHPAEIGAPGGQREPRFHEVERVDFLIPLVYMPAYGKLRYDIKLRSRREGVEPPRTAAPPDEDERGVVVEHRTGVVTYVRTPAGYRYRVVEAGGGPWTESEWAERSMIALALTPAGDFPAPELSERVEQVVPRIGTGTHFTIMAPRFHVLFTVGLEEAVSDGPEAPPTAEREDELVYPEQEGLLGATTASNRLE